MTIEQPGPDDDLNVMNCTLSFECSLKWTELVPTEVANVRHCGTCDHNVTLCRTVSEYIQCATDGACVAFYPASGAESVVLDTAHMRLGIPCGGNTDK